MPTFGTRNRLRRRHMRPNNNKKEGLPYGVDGWQLMLATVMNDMSDGLCFEDGRRRKPRVSANRHNDWPACGISGLLLLTVYDCGLLCVPSDEQSTDHRNDTIISDKSEKLSEFDFDPPPPGPSLWNDPTNFNLEAMQAQQISNCSHQENPMRKSRCSRSRRSNTPEKRKTLRSNSSKSRRSSLKLPSPQIISHAPKQISLPPENIPTNPTQLTAATTVTHPPATIHLTTDESTAIITHPAIFHPTTTDTSHPALVHPAVVIDTTAHPAPIHPTTHLTSAEPPSTDSPNYPTKTTPATLPTHRMPLAHLTRPLFGALNEILSFPTPRDRLRFNSWPPCSTPNAQTPALSQPIPTSRTHLTPLFRALNGFLPFPTPPDRPRSTNLWMSLSIC